jgi:phage-related protein
MSFDLLALCVLLPDKTCIVKMCVWDLRSCSVYYTSAADNRMCAKGVDDSEKQHAQQVQQGKPALPASLIEQPSEY